jgi:CubicO group peptidase (beta-lactamase class C family)
MYPWLEALLVGATATTIIYMYPRFSPKPSGLLSKTTLEWTEGIQQKYDIQGISIGIVASPGLNGDSWRSETHGFGQMDEQGRPVDGKVSTLPATMGESRADSRQTLFAMGSNSKLFAAIAIGMLIENEIILYSGKKLEYSTKIKDILPDWQLLDQHISDHVDVLDLLCEYHPIVRIHLTDSDA